MQFGLVLIGDELLSGKRQDKHFAWVTETLNRRGLKLAWCRIVGDDDARINAALRDAFSCGDIVFSFGGIGATPDDRTRQCAAAALGVPLVAHPQGVAEIVAQYGDKAYPQRVKMAEYPQGARLIPNPVNRVPGFSVQRVHFVPGFPNMGWPMVEWVLQHEYGALAGEIEVELLLRASGSGEGDLIPLMDAVLEAHPGVRLSSLPDATQRQVIEFGIRGAEASARAALARLRVGLTERGLKVSDEKELRYG